MSKLAMLAYPLGKSTISITCDHYQRFLNESSPIEQELSSFASALSKTLISLTLRDAHWSPTSLPETKQLREGVWIIMDRIRGGLQQECAAVVEVTSFIRKLTHQFKQMIDLMRTEQERITNKIVDLVAQVKIKETEVGKCQIAVQNEKGREAEQAWRRQHYVNVQSSGREETPGAIYLIALKDIRTKLDAEVAAQRKEQREFTQHMMDKLKDFKNRLLKAWNLLLLNKNLPVPAPILLPSQKKNPPSDDQIRREISELERRYLLREQEIDDFNLGDLAEIKKKLKLLEEAEMSESREYLMHSASANVVQSEVMALASS